MIVTSLEDTSYCSTCESYARRIEKLLKALKVIKTHLDSEQSSQRFCAWIAEDALKENQ